MADLGMSFCRRSRPEAIHRTVFLATGSKAAGRAAPNRVQRLQTAFGSHRNWSSNGGHVIAANGKHINSPNSENQFTFM